ncbi:MAG: hypothetical protein J3Q66DRAFT_401124 [Benniella sp.]|nr:MAG: hypothetical protein J3Q66DRAFT_401124 [Benniella sp.]
METLINLQEQVPSVKDTVGTGRLVVQEDEVVFDNVNFHYDGRRRGLWNISFTVPKGKTVALRTPTSFVNKSARVQNRGLRYLADGNIVSQGRNDDQVKVRGVPSGNVLKAQARLVEP